MSLGFPIGVSNGPPPGAKASSGKDGFQELADAGVTFVRTGRADWGAGATLDEELAGELALLDHARARGMQCWLYLGEAPNLPAARDSVNERLLTRIVRTVKDHPALGAYKGIDEPRNPLRTPTFVPPAGLVRAYRKLKTLDAAHPLVIVHAPRGTVAQLTPYRPAFDISGVDVFPIAYPPGGHTDSRNKDISAVGDLVRRVRQAGGAKPVWATLQIAWSGTARSQRRPNVIPRFPSLKEERFMAYQAIVAGARGLMFFGGHLTQVLSPSDATLGWNWTFWVRVLRPLVHELASDELRPALLAADAKPGVRTKAGYPNIELVTRRTGNFAYAIVVKRSGPTVEVGRASCRERV